MLEAHDLAEQILKTVKDPLMGKKLLLNTYTIADAILIGVFSSAKSNAKSRVPEMC